MGKKPASHRNQAVPTFSDALLNASPDAALAALEEVGAQAPDLVAAWMHHPNAAAIVEAAERGTGPARKAARRAANVLKARDITLPERRRTATLVARTEETVEAWMLPPDGAGTELFAVAARSPAERYRACFVFLVSSRGIVRVNTGVMSKSQLKEALTEVAPTRALGPVKVPVPWARHRIAEARAAHKERGVPEPLGFTTASSLIEPVPEAAPGHPFDDEGLELSDEDAPSLAAGSEALHELPEFRGWLPDRPAIDELLRKVGERLTPGQEPTPEVVDAAMREEIQQATDRYFSPDVRQELTRRMKDSALSVLAREGEHRALEVVATMKVIDRAGLITDPPHEVGFLRRFFEKALALLAMQSGGKLSVPVPRGEGEESQVTGS